MLKLRKVWRYSDQKGYNYAKNYYTPACPTSKSFVSCAGSVNTHIDVSTSLNYCFTVILKSEWSKRVYFVGLRTAQNRTSFT